jgi:hypothetical protein
MRHQFGIALGGIEEQIGAAILVQNAKAKVKGVCGTSWPRMLSSQQTESAKVITHCLDARLLQAVAQAQTAWPRSVRPPD